jgi:energy-coupling factor transporter transmembrane protein EcfT
MTDCSSNKASKNASFDTSKKLQKYKPFYKIIYQLQLATTIRFKSLLIIFIFLRTVYSLYNNINDVVYIINIIDEKDIKEVKKVLELLSFINFINIFNIVTFLELYDIPEHIKLINKKSILYRKYLKLYKKDCFMIKYI